MGIIYFHPKKKIFYITITHFQQEINHFHITLIHFQQKISNNDMEIQAIIHEIIHKNKPINHSFTIK